MKDYYDDNHAATRLGGCYVWYKGDLHIVKRARKLYVELTPYAGRGDELRVDMFDEELVIMPKSLGYVNYLGHAEYISRLPVRAWKSGINGNNTRVIDTGRSLAGCLKNLHEPMPSMKKAYQLVKDGDCVSCAFDSNFCVALCDGEHGIYLMYKTIAVAYFNEKGQVVIGDSNTHLLNRLYEIAEFEVIV